MIPIVNGCDDRIFQVKQTGPAQGVGDIGLARHFSSTLVR